MVSSSKDSLDSIKRSFKDRCQNTTLIPDGIYNFYIHYVDKYGHATKGYKLNPKGNIVQEGGSLDYSLILTINYNNTICYYPIPLNEKFQTYWTTRSDIRTVTAFTKYVSGKLSNEIELPIYEVMNKLREYLYNFDNPIYRNLYISQVINNATINDDTFEFGSTVNSSGDYLFRVPKEKFKIENETYYDIQYTMEVQLPILPDGYIGYYISYEEYESNSMLTGCLVKRDLMYGNKLIKDKNTQNDPYENVMYFYCSDFDIKDSLKLKYNAISIEKTNDVNYIVVNLSDFFESNPNYNNDAIIHPCDANQIFVFPTVSKNPMIFPITDYELAIANDAKKDRIGKGTALEIKDTYGLFNEQIHEYGDNHKIIASLYNYTNDIYKNKHKKLIRLSDHIYTTEKIYIAAGYNGVVSYESSIIYNDNGYILSQTETNTYKSVTSATSIPYLIDGTLTIDNGSRVFPIACITYPVYDTYFHESKVINNSPKVYYNFVEDPTEENAKKYPGSFVEPINSIDLFKNPQGSISDFHPVTNINYTEDAISITEFNKTVRRSNVIQDETRINSWRQFPIEGYKNITENKGQITNIVGIGSMFLVHTEHSLFMFDTNNMLKTLNTDIQIAQPDAFEVDYKEVFTSDLGFGGLQDKDSAIIDQFGYIFYNNDSNRLYQFDNGQLANIDDDIVEWLLKAKPYNVRFANDKQNNRLLIKMEYDTDNSIILSYNYNVKAFISRHTYHFDKAYNTKNELYLQCDNNHTGCSLHTFVRNADNFGSFDNIKRFVGTVVNNDSILNIIINPNYENIKYLETISYKITKILDAKYANPGSIVQDNRYIKSFSGNKLRVYNDLTNTGTLDIYVEDDSNKNMFANFDKPYWYLGVWNYNYFRNAITTVNTTSSDFLSRIIGNYFIIEFTFTNEDNKKIEFEGLTYNVTQ